MTIMISAVTYITTWPFDLHQLHLCLMWRLSLRAKLRCVIVQQLPEERATSSSFCTSPSFLSESKHASSPSLKSAIDLKWYWDGLPIGLLLPYSQHRWSSETSDHTTAKEWKVRDKTKTANIIIYCCVIKLFGVEDTFLFKLTHFFPASIYEEKISVSTHLPSFLSIQRDGPVLLCLTASSLRPQLLFIIMSRTCLKVLFGKLDFAKTVKKTMLGEWPTQKEEKA